MGKNCIKQPNFTFCMIFPQIICCWTDVTDGCITEPVSHLCQHSLKRNTLTTGGDTTRQVAGDGLLILPVASSGYNRNLPV